MELVTVRVVIFIVASNLYLRVVLSEDTIKPKAEPECNNAAARTDDDTFCNNNKILPTFDFETPSWKTDFELKVEEKTLYVSKAILSLTSPVFEQIFSSDETKNNMEIAEQTANDVIAFLRCIYSQTLSPNTVENAEQILSLVHEFKVSDLKQMCEKVLVESVDTATDANRLLELLAKAHKYNFGLLSDKCADLAADKPQYEMTKAEVEHPLPAEAMVEILRKLNARLYSGSVDMVKLETRSFAYTLEKYIEATPIFSSKKVDSNYFLGRSVKLVLRQEEEESITDMKVVILNDIVLTVTAKLSKKVYYPLTPMYTRHLSIMFNIDYTTKECKLCARVLILGRILDVHSIGKYVQFDGFNYWNPKPLEILAHVLISLE